MNYETFEPHAELAKFIKCYCALENCIETNPSKKIIVPDGFMKMIFHYGDLYKQYDESGKSTTLPRCYVIGPLTKPFEVEPTGKTGLFYVHFFADGFKSFTLNSLIEMKNTPIPLAHLFGEKGQNIERKILHSKTTSERINHIENFLCSQLTQIGYVDNDVKSTVEKIMKTNGQMSVNELSKKTNINRKQLERKFSSSIGLSPKQFSKTIRLQNTLKSLLTRDKTQLTELAYENEYYDQSHFIKDFKEFTGLTPKEFYTDKLMLYRIFYT